MVERRVVRVERERAMEVKMRDLEVEERAGVVGYEAVAWQ